MDKTELLFGREGAVLLGWATELDMLAAAKLDSERDQLKAKNEKLVEALFRVAAGTGCAWSRNVALRSLKENT